LSDQRRRSDGRAATISLEFGVLDRAVRADLDLQLHNVAAGRRSDHACTYRRVVLCERPDVARILVVIQNLVAVCHDVSPKLKSISATPIGRYRDRCPLCTFPTRAKARAAWRSCARSNPR